jgi:vancomycin resistance protein YoaR
MTTDELDPFGPKEQSKSAAATTAAADKSTAPEVTKPPRTASVTTTRPAAPGSSPSVARVLGRVRFGGSIDSPTARFALAFAVGTVAALALVMALALGLSGSYTNRVVPGVHVGSIDVSGMSRDEVIAKIQTSYAYLGQGKVTVTTPVGSATITYQQANRGPDAEAMADAAMSVGHSGNPIGDAASILKSAIAGQTIPVVVHVDPMALATNIRALVGKNAVPPQDAKATLTSGTFAFAPSAPGSGIDEKAIANTIIDQLVQSNAPADLTAGGNFVSLSPQVSDQEAQNAIAAAKKMIVDVNLIWNGAPLQTPDPSQSPAVAVPTQSPPKTYTIPAATIQTWIVFGPKTDGSYGPAVDPALAQAYLSKLSVKIAIPAQEPTVISDSSGTPIGLKSGKNGTGIDLNGTSQAIEVYLDSLANGGSAGSSIAIVTAPIPPQITDVSNLTGMVKIGAWTTTFFPGVSNGNGANIRVPASLLNGQVVAPGAQFSFLSAVGPIDAAHGYALGGAIIGGKSVHTGAMGGGICSASTTMFNAAANAGLQIDERHAHFYYINRYPIGRDATVYSNGTELWDLRWTNDTPYPIVIRGYSTYGSNSKVTMELWSLPLGRTVKWSGGVVTNIVKATDGAKVYNVSTLKPGQELRDEVPTDGFDTSVTRLVTDASGNVLHNTTWGSHYSKVDGLIQVGGPPPPSGSPSQSPGAPTPAPSLPPATPTPAPPAPSASAARRRKVQ